MNPLLKRLASLRWKVRLLEGVQGVCAVVALVLGVGLAVGLSDYWLHLPSLLRALILIGLLVGAAGMFYRFLLKPFSNPCDDLTLALRVEDEYPELNDALATTVQFLKQSKEDEARVGGSASMRDRTIQETIDKADRCDFGRVLDRRAAVAFGLAAFSVAALAALIVSLYPGYAGIAAMRLLEPFGQHTWTRIAVARSAPGGLIDQPADDQRWETIQQGKKDRIAIHRPYFIKVNIDGQIPAQAKVEIKGVQARSEKNIPLVINAKDKTASFVTSIDMTQQHQEFRFRILANDGTFPPRAGTWHKVEVLPPPKLTELDGKRSPQVTLYPPKYTDLPEWETLPPGTGHLDLYAGTNVQFRAKADRELEEAWIEFKPENALLKPGAALSFLGQTNPLSSIAQMSMGQAVWGRFPAKFEDAKPASVGAEKNTTFNIAFMPWVTGSYVLHLRDADGLERNEEFSVNVKRDPIPDVKLIRPATSVTARPDQVLSFKFRVADETFAIRRVYVEYRRKLPDGTPLDLKPVRVVLYEAKEQGAMIQSWMAQIGAPVRPAGDTRLRRKQLDFETTWALKNRFKEGEIVVVQVCAVDFCDIYLHREAGRSHEIELRIEGPEQIVRNTAVRINEIRKKVEEIERKQKKALDMVNEIKKLDEFDQKGIDRVIEAEQMQKDIQNEVGKTPDQGLRKEVADLLKQLKDNKLDKTEVGKQAGRIAGALDQIGENELPQIEPRLVEARNDVAQDGKKSPKTDKTLKETAQLQQKVIDGLSELNQELAPFAKMQDLRDSLRELMQKERDLINDIEQRRADKNDQIRDNPKNAPVVEKEFANDMKRKGQEQQEIAQQLDKLLAQMKAAQKEREKEGNQEDAKKLQEAIEKAEPRLQEEKDKKEKKPKIEPKLKQPEKKDPIASQMKQVADALKEKGDAQQKTLDQAKDILENLDQMMAAMDGRNQDTTKQEIQDRRKGEQKVDELAKKLEQLQEEARQIEKMEDPVEKLKKEKELAKKTEELQKEIEKNARELARLQEKRAAAALNDAAKDLAGAKKNLDAGEDPQPQQQEAKDKLAKAKEELQDSQDELARELLIKIADQLKGLGERQHAVLERSETFQPRFMKRKVWNDAFLDTIEGNIETQTGIAEEAETLKEKIKEARVFSEILNQSKRSMDKASEVMKERFDDGKNLRKPDPTEKLGAEELKREVELHDVTVRHQKQAAQRIDRLLDALKEELEKKKKPKKDNDVAKDDPEKKEEKKEQPRARPGDGIPNIAELKVLKAEQEDLLARTKQFAEKKLDLKNLTEAQRDELTELFEDQDRLRLLFLEASAPPKKEGDMP